MADRWSTAKRQEWIMETVHIFKFINREHIMLKFGVSTPQASKDLNDFIKCYPNLLDYNKSSKRYELDETFAQPLRRSWWP